ncbi:hypothetical protein NDA16_000639 [Ustilago loliicola]|nr:hypothetical protein NDA16_000639 [Ustilago loliicola]
MSTKFRLHPEPGTERPGHFHLGKAIYSTVKNGGFGSALLLPHITVPIYGIYVLLHRTGHWTPEFERGLAFAISLIQGLSLGSTIALSVVRYSASGKAVKGRRIEKSATEEEGTTQHRIEVALRLLVYLFLGTILWEYLVHSKYSPIADEHARDTSSGFLTATGPLRRFFNNESLLPEAREGRDQLAGVRLNYDLRGKAQDFKKVVNNSPRIRVPGTAGPPPKSIFLRAYEKAWKFVTQGPGLGMFEIGPKVLN